MWAYRLKELHDRQHIGELVRGATLRLWNLQVSQRARITAPAKFWPMPWDEDTPDAIDELESCTEEQLAESYEKMKRLMGISDGDE